MTMYITILSLIALAVEPAAVQLPCEEWETRDFWRTAGVARVRECLAAGYSVHYRFSSYNRTVLHWAAAYSDDPEVISVLVEAGANLEDSSPTTYRTPLHLAARYNPNPEIVRALLRHGANINALNERGRTPLHIAALFNANSAVVEELARATDVNSQAAEGLTPLHDAARRGVNDSLMGGPNPEIVAVLLRHGADLSVEASDGGTPMLWAVDDSVAGLIRGETQRRAAIQARFLRTVATSVVAVAALLAILTSLPGVLPDELRTVPLHPQNPKRP